MTCSDKVILAFDLGRSTGLCISDNDEIDYDLETWDYSRFTAANADLYYGFAHDLRMLLDEFSTYPLVIVYEDVQFMVSKAQTNIWSGLRGILLANAFDHEAEILAVPVGTLKKFATGSGKATKKDMICAAVRKGAKPANDNEADAFWLAEFYRHQQASMS